MRLFVLFFLILLSLAGLFAQPKRASKADLEDTFIDAVKSAHVGNFNRSAYLLNSCIREDSTCAACYYELSKIVYGSNDMEQALHCSLKAYMLDKNNYWYAKNYVSILLTQNYFVDAKNVLVSLANTSSATVDDKFLYAAVLSYCSEYKRALKVLDEIEQNYGNSLKINELRIQILIRQKKYEAASAQVYTLLHNFPDNYASYGSLAELAFLEHKNSTALCYFDTLLRFDTRNAKSIVSKANFYANIGDSLNCFATYNLIFTDSSYSADVVYAALQGVMSLADQSQINRRFLDRFFNANFLDSCSDENILRLADQYYSKCNNTCVLDRVFANEIRLDSSNVVLWERYVFNLNVLAKFDTIRSIYLSNSFVRTRSAFLNFLMGIYYLQTKSVGFAITALRSGLDLARKNEFLTQRIASVMAEAYYNVGQKDSAYYFFTMVANLSNPDIGTLNNFAYYMSLDNLGLSRALELSALTIKADPKNHMYLDTYAWICYKLKRYDEALKFVKLAFDCGGAADADVLEHYGDIAYCCNKVSLARKMWAKSNGIFKSAAVQHKIVSFVCN